MKPPNIPKQLDNLGKVWNYSIRMPEFIALEELYSIINI